MYNSGHPLSSNGDGSRPNSNYQPSSSLLQQQLAQQAAQHGMDYDPRSPSQANMNPNQYRQPQYSENNQNSQFAPAPIPQSSRPIAYQPPRPTPELAAILNGLDSQKFAGLNPIQQEQVKAFMQSQNAGKAVAAQQSSLGLGYPSTAGTGSGSFSGQPQQPPIPAAMFFKSLHEHLNRRGSSLTGQPMIEGKPIDLHRMFQFVVNSGGYQNVAANSSWRYLLSHLGFGADNHNHPDARVAAIAQMYFSILAPFELEVQNIQYGPTQPQQRVPPSAQNSNYSQSPQLQNLPPPLQNRAPFYGQSTGNSGGSSPYGSQPSPRLTQASIPQQLSRAPTPSQQGQQYPRGSLQSLGRANSQESDRKGKGREDQYLDVRARMAPNKMEGMIKQDPDWSTLAMNPRSAPTNSSRPSTSTVNSPIPVNMSIASSAIPNPFDTKASAPSIGEPTMAQHHSQYSANPSSNSPRRQQSQNGQSGKQVESNKRSREETVIPGPATLAERKRNVISYTPIAKSSQSSGGWDLANAEDSINRITGHKPVRAVHDLGQIDVKSLTMAIKSRLATEVTFALNSLLLISTAMRLSNADPSGMHFPLGNCGDLLDELIELLEESAFGIVELEVYGQEVKKIERKVEEERSTYRQLFRIIALEETELRLETPTPLARAATYQDDGACPLPPIELVLAITNLLRNLSINEENAVVMAQHSELLSLLLRVSELPIRHGISAEAGASRWPLEISPADSMALKKDALETISNLGQMVLLDRQDDSTSISLFHLLLFFVSEAHHKDQLYFDLMDSPSSYSKIQQPEYCAGSHYLDLVIGAFARITVHDVNREILGRLIQEDLFDVFQSLIQLLPITEADFRLLTSEGGLIFMENLAMSLYNLAFLSPPSLKLRLRAQPSIIKGIVRVIRRLLGTSAEENAFTRLCQRCVSILKVLSELGGVKTSVAEIPWYGLAMAGEDDDVPVSCQPVESDRGTVRARLAPSSAGVTNRAPPVLMGCQELYESVGITPIFGQLLSLLDGIRDQ